SDHEGRNGHREALPQTAGPPHQPADRRPDRPQVRRAGRGALFGRPARRDQGRGSEPGKLRADVGPDGQAAPGQGPLNPLPAPQSVPEPAASRTPTKALWAKGLASGRKIDVAILFSWS